MNHNTKILLLTIGIVLIVGYVIDTIMKRKNPNHKGLPFFIRELIKMYSNEESYFSKKRVESGVAFVIAQWGMVHWLVVQLTSDTCKVSSSDIGLWSAIEFAICGYVINQIQKEKKDDSVNVTPDSK